MGYEIEGRWPSYNSAEIEAVSKVLESGLVNYWTGNEVRAFEEEFAHWCGVSHAVALANGTVALELALRAVGVECGDEVIVSPRSFLASATAPSLVGAVPVFVDLDPNTQALSVDSMRAALTEKTKALIVVHLGGLPADMDPILAFAKEYGLFVIEDCAQAHGAQYKGRSVGSIGDIGAWSFCQDKIMTTGGEGGMLTMNSPELWAKAWSYKDHGKSYERVHRKDHPPGFRWLHTSLGNNYRLTEMQAAIGRKQLETMPATVAQRHHVASEYALVCEQYEWVRVQQVPDHSVHAYYRYYVFVDAHRLPVQWTRDAIMDALNNRGVPCFQGSCPNIAKEALFDELPFRSQPLPTAEMLGNTSLMFLVHPTLTANDLKFLTTEIKAVFDAVERDRTQ